MSLIRYLFTTETIKKSLNVIKNTKSHPISLGVSQDHIGIVRGHCNLFTGGLINCLAIGGVLRHKKIVDQI